MKLKSNVTSSTLISKDTKTFLKGGMADLLSGIDLPPDALLPKRSEDFVQKVLKDTKGNLVVNEPLHNVMHRFIRIAKKKGFNKYMLLGGFGMGKCFLIGEMINTCSGIDFPVEKIKAGMKIYSYDINKNKGLKIKLEKDSFFAGIQDCYEIKFSNGVVQRVSYNHPFLMRDGNWKNAEDLAICDCVKTCSEDGYSFDDCSYEHVVYKDYIGERETWGIEVPNTHIHVVNNIISHNTEQMCIGYSLYRIAKEPNILIKVVHVSDTEATKRCRSIRDYIERDDDFQALAPHIQPTNIWGSERFTVKRTSPSPNCTIEAYSVLGTGIGGRANLIIFDDPQDLRTAVYEPTTRAKIEDTIKNIWITRLITTEEESDDNSEVLLMMNKWHDSDLASYVQRNPSWAWLSIAVDESMEFLKIEDSFGRKFKYPLWSKFGKKALEDRKVTLGERDFKRGYCLIPYTDSDKTFGFFERCCHFGVSPRAIIESESNWLFVGGIDFAGSKRPGTVLSIVAVHKKTGLKLPIEIVTLRKSSDLTGHIVRTFREYGVDLYIAENNGVQEAIIDLLRAAIGEEKFKKYNIKIEGFLTGRGKMDMNTGLPSMDKEFENKEWFFCFDEKPDVSDDMENKPWSLMYYEMLNHPFHQTSDIAMSLYFCREGCKKLIRGEDSGPQVY